METIGTNRPPFDSPDQRLVPQRVLQASRCRCGSRLEAGDVAIALVGVPELVTSLFATRIFCQYRCVRAEFLEHLETLDALVGCRAEELVTDLRATYAELAREFASLLHE